MPTADGFAGAASQPAPMKAYEQGAEYAEMLAHGQESVLSRPRVGVTAHGLPRPLSYGTAVAYQRLATA